MTLDALKGFVLLFVAVLVQVSILSAYAPLGGTPDLVLVLLIAIALLRGSIFGAAVGFAAGLLIDTANLGTLGFTSLLLTLAGFWTGRYGETTAQDRFHAPFTSVAIITFLYGLAALALSFVLGEPAPAGAVIAGLPVTMLLNLLLTWPVYRFARRLFRLRTPSTGCTRYVCLASGRRSRRFLPGDPRVAEPYRLTPQLALRVAILGFVAVAVFAVLFLRLWALQVLSGNKYRVEATANRVRTIQIEAPRGDILARDGQVLVGNTVGWSLELWPADLPKHWPAERKELRALAVAADIPVEKILAQMKLYADDPSTPIVLRRGIHPDQRYFLQERQLKFPACSSRRPRFAATRTSRSPRRCSGTSGRSRRTS